MKREALKVAEELLRGPTIGSQVSREEAWKRACERICTLEKDKRKWIKRYTALLNYIERTWCSAGSIPETLYHIDERCPFCNMRHQGSC